MLIGTYDLVADGSDNFATRYLVSDACYLAKKPLVTAALGTFDPRSPPSARMRKRERHAQSDVPLSVSRAAATGQHPTCAEAGVLGALPGVLGSLMALEVVREIVGFGEGLVGRLLMIDARTMRFETLDYGVGQGQSAQRRAPEHFGFVNS